MDEDYIINLCNEILKQEAKRQYHFNFLRGDKAVRDNGVIVNVLEEQGRKLPVDAYYENLHLVIEYLEIQHFHPVPFFDNRMTCSNVTRGEQRRIYDNRRRARLPENGICLIEFHYTDFNHNPVNGNLIHNEDDELVILERLQTFLEF